jgi:hypothetical protein
MRSGLGRVPYFLPMSEIGGSSDRAHLLGRVERYVRHRPRGGGSPPVASGRPSLTISRECGAGLRRLERPLLEYLDGLEEADSGGWVLFDQSLLGNLLERGRLPEAAPAFVPEAAKFRVAPLLGESLSRPSSQWNLFNHSANAIRLLCHGGNAIIVGRAGNQVTADLPNTFHVRLVSDKGRRIAHLSRHYRIDEREAEELANETDKARAKFVKRHTGAEIGDPLAYHLVLNTNHFNDETAVRVIADSLHEWARLNPASEPPPALGKVVEGRFR